MDKPKRRGSPTRAAENSPSKPGRLMVSRNGNREIAASRYVQDDLLKPHRHGSTGPPKSKVSSQIPQRTTATDTARGELSGFEVMTPKETAIEIKSSESFLAKARMTGEGPPFIKIGRMVRYPKSLLLAWLEARIMTSTSQQQPADPRHQRIEPGKLNAGSGVNEQER